MEFKELRKKTPNIIIVLLFTLSQLLCHPQLAACFNGKAGAAAALEEFARQQQEWEREQRMLGQQKELMRYQYELEAERQRLAEEARKKELTEEQQKKEAEEKEEKRNATYTGTGFFINTTGYLISNAHVVTDKTYLAIRDSRGKFYRVTVVAEDKKNDLVLLHTIGSFPALRIVHSDQVQKGQHVLTVGYPQISIQGNESKVTDGIINSFSGLNNDDNWFQISVPIQGGNSGSPLVNESGEIVGVIVATVNDQNFYNKTGSMPQNINYAIKSKVLLQFLSTQQVSNITNTRSKMSIAQVDNATVLVIAKNTPLDVPYESPPVDIKIENAQLAQIHPDWKTITQSKGFKEWLENTPATQDAFISQMATERAKVLTAYKQYLIDRQETADQARVEAEKAKKEHETHELLAQRDNEITKTYSDWPTLKKDLEFLEWIATQTESTRNMHIPHQTGH